jgi:hypothetical protein
MARTASRVTAAPRRAGGKAAAAKQAASKSASTKKAAPRAAAKPAASRGTGKAAASRGTAKPAAPKRSTGRSVAAKAAVRGKAAAAKKAPVRAKAKAPARRAVTARKATPRKAPVRPAAVAGNGHRFVVSHLNEADFKADGLRAYAQYRDLGMAAATGGLCQAHVIRLQAPCTDEVRKRHTHAVDLQLVYVLKGWVKNEFEGYGEQMMSVGSCWLQPSGIEHTVLDFSPDCELLEIVVPADFKTTELTA